MLYFWERSVKLLRRSYLLNPKVSSTIESLIRTYKQVGLDGNAWIYMSQRGYSSSELRELAEVLKKHKWIEADLMRLIGENFSQEEEILRSILKNPTSKPWDESWEYALYFSKDPKQYSLAWWIEIFKTHCFHHPEVFFKRYVDELHLPVEQLKKVCESQSSSNCDAFFEYSLSKK